MKLKKVMAATLATMMCLSSFSMMNVWADKKEDSEPLVINYISARGETDAALKTLKKLAEDYKKKPGLTYFLKGKINGGAVYILEAQESYKMNSFALADCLVELEPEKEFCEKGTPVNILMIL